MEPEEGKRTSSYDSALQRAERGDRRKAAKELDLDLDPGLQRLRRSSLHPSPPTRDS